MGINIAALLAGEDLGLTPKTQTKVADKRMATVKESYDWDWLPRSGRTAEEREDDREVLRKAIWDGVQDVCREMNKEADGEEEWSAEMVYDSNSGTIILEVMLDSEDQRFVKIRYCIARNGKVTKETVQDFTGICEVLRKGIKKIDKKGRLFTQKVCVASLIWDVLQDVFGK